MDPTFNNELPSWRTLLSAALLAAAFRFPSVGFAVFIALVPWLYEIVHSPLLKTKLRQTMWLSIFAQGAICYWMIEAARGSLGLSAPVATLVGIVFFAVNQVPFYLLVVTIHTLKQSGALKLRWQIGHVLFLALAYATFDAYAPKFIPDSLGYALAGSPVFRQAADIGGVCALTFTIVVSNLGFFCALHAKQSGQKWHSFAVTAFGTCALLFVYGEFRTQHLATSNVSIPMILVRGDTEPSVKAAALTGRVVAQEQIVARYLELSGVALQIHPEAEIIVWPETAFPRPFENGTSSSEKLSSAVREFARTKNKMLIFGGFTRDAYPSATYNSIIVLQASGERQIYRKNFLMPFAEHIPIVGDVPFVRNFATYQSQAGKGLNLLEISARGKRLSALPVICFEAFSMDHLLRGAVQGADFILNISEDVWYASATEAVLQANIAALESVEVRKAQLRVSASGFTGQISALGFKSPGLPIAGLENSASFLNLDIETNEPTIFELTRGRFSIMCLFAFVGWSLAYLVKKRTKWRTHR